MRFAGRPLAKPDGFCYNRGMADNTLNCAVVGCGVIGPTHAHALSTLRGEGVRLAAFSDEVPERAAVLAAQHGGEAKSFEAVLADPEIDAVHICVPSGLHAALGVRALEAGKHVVVEKPMDVTLAACDALLAAQKASGRRLAVISQHRFDGASVVVKDALDTGLLGRMVYAESQVPWFRSQEYYDSGDWRGTWALDGGGAAMNQGVHNADLICWLCGPVESVYAQARTLAHERIETEDVLTATLTFQNGAIGSWSASTAIYPGFAVKVGVYGTEGSAIIEGDRLHTLSTKSGVDSGGEGVPSHALQMAGGGTKAAASDPAAIWGGAHEAQIADFVRCCRTGETPAVDGAEGRKAVALVLALYESARTGAVVRL